MKSNKVTSFFLSVIYESPIISPSSITAGLRSAQGIEAHSGQNKAYL